MCRPDPRGRRGWTAARPRVIMSSSPARNTPVPKTMSSTSADRRSMPGSVRARRPKLTSDVRARSSMPRTRFDALGTAMGVIDGEEAMQPRDHGSVAPVPRDRGAADLRDLRTRGRPPEVLCAPQRGRALQGDRQRHRFLLRGRTDSSTMRIARPPARSIRVGRCRRRSGRVQSVLRHRTGSSGLARSALPSAVTRLADRPAVPGGRSSGSCCGSTLDPARSSSRRGARPLRSCRRSAVMPGCSSG